MFKRCQVKFLTQRYVQVELTAFIFRILTTFVFENIY